MPSDPCNYPFINSELDEAIFTILLAIHFAICSKLIIICYHYEVVPHIFFFTTCTTKPRHSLIIRTRLLFSVFLWNPLMSSILSEVGKWPFLNVWTLSWGTAVLSVVHIRTLLVLKDLLSRLVCDRFLFCFNFLLLTTFWHFLSKNRKLLRGVKNHFTKQCQNYNRIS